MDYQSLSSGVVGDNIRFHDSVAAVMCFSQCVRVGGNVGPEVLYPGALTIDHFLVIVDKGVALPARGASQLATAIGGCLEAGEKPIDVRARIPPNRDEPSQISPGRAGRLALRD